MTTTKACPDCFSGWRWFDEHGNETTDVKFKLATQVCHTCLYSSLPDAELDDRLKEVSVECQWACEDQETCDAPTSVPERCDGSGKRWLLREKRGHYDGGGRWVDEGYVYSGDYDGIRAALEGNGWHLVIRTGLVNPNADEIYVWSNDSLGAERMASVKHLDGITGLRAIKVAVLRANDATEGG